MEKSATEVFTEMVKAILDIQSELNILAQTVMVITDTINTQFEARVKEEVEKRLEEQSKPQGPNEVPLDCEVC